MSNQAKGKILIVDDMDVVLKLEEILLKRTGAEVIKARDGREALALARSEQPDVIVCDLVMPQMNGDVLTRFLRQAPDTRDVTVIVVTSKGDEATEERCRTAGADHFLTKPIRHDELLDIVREALQKRGLQTHAGA